MIVRNMLFFMLVCHHDINAAIGVSLDSATTRDEKMLCGASRCLIPAT